MCDLQPLPVGLGDHPGWRRWAARASSSSHHPLREQFEEMKQLTCLRPSADIFRDGVLR